MLNAMRDKKYEGTCRGGEGTTPPVITACLEGDRLGKIHLRVKLESESYT